MSNETSIEWTDKVWNPVTGCTKVSKGCANCYAERMFHRPYPGRDFTDVRCHPERLDQPLRWRKPCRIFVNSMSDLFHEDVPFDFIKQVWSTASKRLHHTFQILTKRPGRMIGFTQWMAGYDDISIAEWPRNCWLGVSVEDQKTADERIPVLLQTPAAVRWVSYEPALGPVDFSRINYFQQLNETVWEAAKHGGLDPAKAVEEMGFPQKGQEPVLDVLKGTWFDGWDSGKDGKKLDWIVAGGESGPQARPAHPEWFRSVKEQCAAARVPFFMKQITERGKKVPFEKFPLELQVREFPTNERDGF